MPTVDTILVSRRLLVNEANGCAAGQAVLERRAVMLRQTGVAMHRFAAPLAIVAIMLAAPSFLVTTTKVRSLDPPMPFQFNFDSTYKVK